MLVKQLVPHGLNLIYCLPKAEAVFGIANRLVRSSPVARKIIGRVRMMDRETLHEFWREPEPEGNVPTDYIAPDTMLRSKTLLELISDLPKGDRILEVGCNAGRNLAYLFNSGYRNLEGVEISPHAVELLRAHYPELAEIPVHVGAAEDILPGYPDQAFDLVFTMAVLEHIHPESIEVFDHIARIAKRIVAIEPTEYHVSTRQFPHDIPALFGDRGFKLTGVTPLDHVLPTYSAFRLRQR